MRIICFSLTYLEFYTRTSLPESFYQKLAQLQYLNTLRFCLRNRIENKKFTGTEILAILANFSTSLRHVTMTSRHTVYLTSKLLESLVNSKWELFDSPHIEMKNENLPVDENLKPNVHLQSLKLNCIDLKPEVAIHFVSKFVNLKVLQLGSVSEKVMYNIAKYQVIGNLAS